MPVSFSSRSRGVLCASILCLAILGWSEPCDAQFNPANASFSGTTDQNLLTHDFGTVRQGSPGLALNFAIFNRLAPSGTTSAMSWVGTTSLGNSASITVSGGPINGLVGGGQVPLQLLLSTSQPGQLQVSYLLEFASDDLPAAMHEQLAIGGFAVVLPIGDYDSDGDVDSNDYARWKSTFGSAGSQLAADGNMNGIVDAADYVIWRDHHTAALNASGTGSISPSAGTTVPEPTTFTIVACLVAAVNLWKLSFSESLSQICRG